MIYIIETLTLLQSSFSRACTIYTSSEKKRSNWRNETKAFG